MTTQASALRTRGQLEVSPLEAALADPNVNYALHRFAMRKTRHVQDAEDLANSTLEAAVARENAGTGWKSDPPPLLTFLGSVMNGLMSNQRRTNKRRPTMAEGETENAPSESPDAAEAMVEGEEEDTREKERARLKAELRAYLATKANGAIPLALLAAIESGVSGREKLAALIGCSVNELDNARERLVHHLARLKKGAPPEAPS